MKGRKKTNPEYVLQFCLELWQNQMCQLTKQKFPVLKNLQIRLLNLVLFPYYHLSTLLPPAKERIRERKKREVGDHLCTPNTTLCLLYEKHFES